MKKIKWFWSWQDESEENWLEEMALAGWKLKSIPLPGIYRFEPIAPSRIAYRLDFHNKQKAKLKKYLGALFDDHWEFITKLKGWLYFCKPIEDQSNLPIKKDPQAKLDKFNHQTTLMGAAVPFMVLWFPLIGTQASSPAYEILIVVYVLALIAFVWIIVKCYQRIRQLRKQIPE